MCVCSDEMGLFPPCGTRESSPFIVTAGYFRGFMFVTFQLLDKSLDDLKDYCCKKKKKKNGKLLLTFHANQFELQVAKEENTYGVLLSCRILMQRCLLEEKEP